MATPQKTKRSSVPDTIQALESLTLVAVYVYWVLFLVCWWSKDLGYFFINRLSPCQPNCIYSGFGIGCHDPLFAPVYPGSHYDPSNILKLLFVGFALHVLNNWISKHQKVDQKRTFRDGLQINPFGVIFNALNVILRPVVAFLIKWSNYIIAIPIWISLTIWVAVALDVYLSAG